MEDGVRVALHQPDLPERSLAVDRTRRRRGEGAAADASLQSVPGPLLVARRVARDQAAREVIHRVAALTIRSAAVCPNEHHEPHTELCRPVGMGLGNRGKGADDDLQEPKSLAKAFSM